MGGGGDGGYADKQQQVENQKAAARASLNALFGVAPSPTSSNPIPGDPRDGAVSNQGEIDQAGANKTAREAIYQQIRDNAFGAGKRALDERKITAARQNKFALFAQGLNGGSEDIDQNALLNRTYSQGLVDLGARADGAKADIQSSDEQTRLGLLQSVDSGMDQTSAVSSALAQMRNNADKASAQAQSQTVGDLFGDSGLLYTQSQAAKGRAAARYPQLFSATARPASASSGTGGIITRT